MSSWWVFFYKVLFCPNTLCLLLMLWPTEERCLFWFWTKLRQNHVRCPTFGFVLTAPFTVHTHLLSTGLQLDSLLPSTCAFLQSISVFAIKKSFYHSSFSLHPSTTCVPWRTFHRGQLIFLRSHRKVKTKPRIQISLPYFPLVFTVTVFLIAVVKSWC